MCKHIFCETCISDTVGKLKTRDAESQNENESSLSCPLCRVVNRCPGNTDDLLNWIRTLEMAEQTEVEVKVENMGVCMPCKKLNNTTRAVKYCLDCRESLCTQCFEDTQRFRAFQNHTVVEINGDDKDKFRKKNEWDMNQTLATYLACKHHPNKNVNFVCENHDELCCQACVILNHRQCDKVTELQQQILQMDPEQKSTDLKDSLGNTVNKIIIQCQNVIKDIKDNETENKTAADKIDESLRNMRTKANRLFDVLEENISQENKAFLKKDSMSNDTTVQEIEEIISKLKLSSNLLENITIQGNRTLEYVVRRKILNILSESETRLLETSLNAKMYGVELKPGSILSNFVDVDVNDTTKLATVKLVDSEVDLTEHTRRCRKITKTGTYHIQSEKSQVYYPTYSGLVYTPDNEVLLVDSENGMIRLASDTYKHLASCNSITFNTKRKDASKKPFSATFLDSDIVAASVPQKKTMLILKGLVTPGNGYVTESKRTKMCRIWLSGDKIYLLYRSRLSRSVCGA